MPYNSIKKKTLKNINQNIDKGCFWGTFTLGLFSSWLVSGENWRMYFLRASLFSSVKWKVGLDQFRGPLQVWSWMQVLDSNIINVSCGLVHAEHVHNINTDIHDALDVMRFFFLCVDSGTLQVAQIIDLYLPPSHDLEEQ